MNATTLLKPPPPPPMSRPPPDSFVVLEGRIMRVSDMDECLGSNAFSAAIAGVGYYIVKGEWRLATAEEKKQWLVIESEFLENKIQSHISAVQYLLGTVERYKTMMQDADASVPDAGAKKK